jgi:hypothetical protein
MIVGCEEGAFGRRVERLGGPTKARMLRNQGTKRKVFRASGTGKEECRQTEGDEETAAAERRERKK